MKTATLTEITSMGDGFLSSLHAGETVTILQNGKAVALLLGINPINSPQRPLGCYSGQIQVSEDFDAPLAEFEQAINAAL